MRILSRASHEVSPLILMRRLVHGFPVAVAILVRAVSPEIVEVAAKLKRPMRGAGVVLLRGDEGDTPSTRIVVGHLIHVLHVGLLT